MTPDRFTTSGEKPGFREARDRMTRQLVEAGNRPDYAHRKATEAARRVDRKEGEKV